MYSIFQIVNYFIKKAEADNTKLYHTQAYKLAYLSYASCLCVYAKKLFIEDIQAWQFGPAVPEFYYVARRIQEDDTSLPYFAGYEEIRDFDIIDVLDDVWDTFRSWTASQLIEFLQLKNSPWDKTWNNGKGDGHIISDHLTVEYYRQFLSKNL